MKKLMFAFACAASVAAFGALSTGTAQGFEFMASGATNIGVLDDGGGQGTTTYFAYVPASGSSDGSIVKTYGNGDNLPLFNYGLKIPEIFMADEANEHYLELSTEGGTLWRGYNTTDQHAGEDYTGRELGSGVDLDPEEATDNVYVDTLVQFTPTEDGTAPTVDPVDQMAIWLNVDSTDPEAPVTNLCVLAAICDENGGSQRTVFKALNKDEGGRDIVPGQWYRLTVKMYGDITDGEGIPGFVVYIDGTPIKTDKTCLPESYYATVLGGQEGLFVSETDMINGSVFCSLWTTQESMAAECDPTSPTFMGVGFKGSGAIDDLVITKDEPNIFEAVDSLDFTLAWGDEISAVSYTINGETATAVNGEAIECAPNAEVTLTVTLAEPGWYTVDAESAAGFTVTEAGQTHTITASPIDSPIAGELLDDVKAWAKSFATALTPEQIAACAFAKNAYLMNTDLSAEPGLEITSITEVEDGWQITVKGTQGENAVTLKGINGQLNIKAAATLEGLATAEATPVNLTDADFDEYGVATIKVTGDNKNFMKATVGVKATTAE